MTHNKLAEILKQIYEPSLKSQLEAEIRAFSNTLKAEMNTQTYVYARCFYCAVKIRDTEEVKVCNDCRDIEGKSIPFNPLKFLDLIERRLKYQWVERPGTISGDTMIEILFYRWHQDNIKIEDNDGCLRELTDSETDTFIKQFNSLSGRLNHTFKRGEIYHRGISRKLSIWQNLEQMLQNA